jgi:tetratricopeptide (TPR) repeat protein
MKISIFLLLLALLPGSQSSGALDKAIRLYEEGEFKQAVNLLLQLSDSSPADPNVKLWLAKSFLKIRKWNDAVHELEKAVRFQPSNAQYHLWLGRACGARASHSIFFTAIRWAQRVVKEFETARSLAPNDLDVRFDLLEYYLNAPGIVGGGSDKAEAEAQAISKLDPAKGYTARATIFQKNKNWDLAKKELTQATIDYPNDADAYKDLAIYLLDRKDFRGALDYAKKTLALDSESKPARLIVAASLTRQQADLDQAARTLSELAAGTLGENDPAFEEVYYWLGECHLAKGNKAKARESFERALAFNPDYDKAKESSSDLK